MLSERVSELRPRQADIAGLAFLGLTSASVMWATFPDQAWHSALSLTLALLFFFALRRSVTTPARVRAICVAYLWGCVIAVGVALFQNRTALSLGDRMGITNFNVNTLAFARSPGSCSSRWSG